MKKQIAIAAKLYRCQDSAKTLFGVNYQERIKPYRQAVAGYMEDHNCNEIEAAYEICKDEKIGGITIMLIMAAAVEICES